MLRGNLAGDENFLARNATGAHALAHAAFVAVCLSGIYMAIAHFNGVTNRLRSFAIRNKPSAKPDFRNFHSV